MDINKYLTGTTASEIRVGQSGANVYEIDGSAILKNVKRSELKNDMFDTYTKEALFYQVKKGSLAIYLPMIMDVEISDEEIIVLMKKYKVLDRSDFDTKIEKILKTLALIHTDTIPDFLNTEDNKKELLSAERIDYHLKGWQSVLAEHSGAFDEALLEPIARSINEIMDWHDSEAKVLTHGDYHWENLLEDEDGRIIVCDWQGVKIGGESEDLSFFISRLGADGVNVDSEEILSLYAGAVSDISGRTVDTEDIRRHMAAANIITTFQFWHEFLHGNDEGRVRGIFEKMIDDFGLWAR